MPADVVVLGGEAFVVLLLAVHLLGEKVVFGFQLASLGDVPDGDEQGDVGQDADQQRPQHIKDPGPVEVRAADHGPAAEEQVLAGREGQVEEPLPGGKAVAVAVHQQNEDPQQKGVEAQADGADHQLEPQGLGGYSGPGAAPGSKGGSRRGGRTPT